MGYEQRVLDPLDFCSANQEDNQAILTVTETMRPFKLPVAPLQWPLVVLFEEQY